MIPFYNLFKIGQPLCQKTSSYLLYGIVYRFRLWVYRLFKFEEFANKQVLLDEFDEIHLKFVFMGFHDMEKHYKLKELFFSKYTIADL